MRGLWTPVHQVDQGGPLPRSHAQHAVPRPPRVAAFPGRGLLFPAGPLRPSGGALPTHCCSEA
eukprot:1546671-Alexandrium_andersonii.AAC.1